MSVYDLERMWVVMGYTPADFMTASLRQVYAVVGAMRERARREWEHTLMVYTAVRNTTARKRSELVEPNKMLDQMFPKPVKAPSKATSTLMDKFRMLQVHSGGRDNRKVKG